MVNSDTDMYLTLLLESILYISYVIKDALDTQPFVGKISNCQYFRNMQIVVAV